MNELDVFDTLMQTKAEMDYVLKILKDTSISYDERIKQIEDFIKHSYPHKPIELLKGERNV